MSTVVMPQLDLETLVREHHAGVWRYLRLLGCTREQADDLTQETFLVVIRKGFEDIDRAATATFLRKTARFEFLHARRNLRTRREVDLDAAESVARERLADGGDAYVNALKRCIEELRGKARDAVNAVYRDQLTPAATAEKLGMKENGLKTLLQRSRAVLKACIERKTKGAA
jgi:RNA polymerase sigma-70 factor (ECF subfamily)